MRSPGRPPNVNVDRWLTSLETTMSSVKTILVLAAAGVAFSMATLVGGGRQASEPAGDSMWLSSRS
jgi:hypothetical protein